MADEPQLRMVRPHLRALPPLVLPEGVRLASWQLGWGEAWTRIIAASFAEPPARFDFAAVMRADTPFAPERVLFLCRGDEPVATASAWHNPQFRREQGILHYVGVLPAWQGQGLGYVISLAALHRMVKERRSSAALLTDDHRLAAIKTYLRLGFVPERGRVNCDARWRAIFAQLGMAEAGERLL